MVRIVKLHGREKEGEGWGDGLAFLFFSVSSSFFFLLPLLPLLERGRVFFFYGRKP